ncbi:hypothetical protein BDZ45DRAFT_739882 [Acephala macrosclerotiorum]|nr:hypothetical protein BDZ45DRAFT_739882 [Acephala macrosclerotiorum]
MHHLLLRGRQTEGAQLKSSPFSSSTEPLSNGTGPQATQLPPGKTTAKRDYEGMPSAGYVIVPKLQPLRNSIRLLFSWLSPGHELAVSTVPWQWWLGRLDSPESVTSPRVTSGRIAVIPTSNHFETFHQGLEGPLSASPQWSTSPQTPCWR